MTDYAQMILELRRFGITAKGIALWGSSRGRKFSHHAIQGIVKHGHEKIRSDIAKTIEEFYQRVMG